MSSKVPDVHWCDKELNNIRELRHALVQKALLHIEWIHYRCDVLEQLTLDIKRKLQQQQQQAEGSEV
jgi:tRNA A37 threonylcarbamoyladenosine biosynthesis protein TsaE